MCSLYQFHKHLDLENLLFFNCRSHSYRHVLFWCPVSSVLTSLNLIPDTVNHRKDCGTVRYRNNWMSVLLLCRFRANVNARQHHQLLWRTARYSTPRILFTLLPHTVYFAMLGFCYCQICTPCVWHSLLTDVTFVLLASTSLFMSNLCYIVWYFCSLQVLFSVYMFLSACNEFWWYYKREFNTECVVSPVCFQIVFFFLQVLFTVHLHFVLGTLCMHFYEVQFCVYQSKC